MPLFHNRRTNTRKLGGTIEDQATAFLLRPWQHKCSLKAKYFTMAFRKLFKKEHALLYMYFTQHSAIL